MSQILLLSSQSDHAANASTDLHNVEKPQRHLHQDPSEVATCRDKSPGLCLAKSFLP